MQARNLAPAILFDENRRLVASAPYPIQPDELARQFATNGGRQRLLEGLCAWLSALHAIVEIDFVWIGGSFVKQKPDPSDIDVVVFFRYRPTTSGQASNDDTIRAHAHLFSHHAVEQEYDLDSALVPLDIQTSQLIHICAYWAMVFSNDENGGRRAFYTLKWDPAALP